jgi:aminoglycoside 3-N-acetyltransferase
MLEHLHIPRDGMLLIHSAFHRFAREGYEVDDVLETIIDYMSPGTLLMPTMSWRYVKPEKPVFNELTTPSNTGVLTERFRVCYSEARSLHPTHSVAARGRLASEITSTHHLCVTPCGPLSPFGKLAAADGHVVMMGVGFDCCTMIHHVEEIMFPDIYCRPAGEVETYQCQGRTGMDVEVKLRRHRFMARDFWQYQDNLAASGKLRIYACDSSVCRGFKAQELVEVVKKSLIRNPCAVLAVPGQRYRLM